jgi:hypothetical protein
MCCSDTGCAALDVSLSFGRRMPRQATSFASLRRGEKWLYLLCVHLRCQFEPTARLSQVKYAGGLQHTSRDEC